MSLQSYSKFFQFDSRFTLNSFQFNAEFTPDSLWIYSNVTQNSLQFYSIFIPVLFKIHCRFIPNSRSTLMLLQIHFNFTSKISFVIFEHFRVLSDWKIVFFSFLKQLESNSWVKNMFLWPFFVWSWDWLRLVKNWLQNIPKLKKTHFWKKIE